MRRTALAAGLALLVAAGCASRFQGDAHRSTDFDFSTVRGLALVPSPGRTLPPESQAVHEMIEQELARQLRAKGYQRAPVEEADLLVHYSAGLHAKVRMSGGAATEGQDARMTLQFLEPGSRHSVWYGWTAATWRGSSDPRAEVEKAVTFLLERFPDAGEGL